MAFNLPRLPQTIPNYGQAQIWWQQVVEAIESQEGAQDAVLTALAAAQASIVAAQADIVAAQANISSQLTLIQTNQRRDAIGTSYTIPSINLSATDAGANASITIANHVRRYGDESSLSVTGATLTGRAYSTDYGIYYDDTTRANATPTYQSTTDLKTAQSNYVAGRHYVGTVTTPASGGAASSGGTAPSGTGYKTSTGGAGYYL